MSATQNMENQTSKETVDNGNLRELWKSKTEDESGNDSDEETEDEAIDLPTKTLTVDSTTIIQQVKELTATFEKLVLQIKPQDADHQEQLGQQDIGSFYDLYRLWQEQVANLTAIQNMQADDFQKQILENDQLRQKLLDDLKDQEETHMREMEKLKAQCKSELEAKDKICLELEHELLRLREDNELNMACSICLDPWAFTGHHRLVALSCGHLFGDPCIREYLQKSQMCPHCRASVSSNDIRYLFGRPS